MSPTRFVAFVYRMPAKPSRVRLAVWRQLKRIDAVYLQQSVCVFPESTSIRNALEPIQELLKSSGGSFHLLPVGRLPDEEREKLVARFRYQALKQEATAESVDTAAIRAAERSSHVRASANRGGTTRPRVAAPPSRQSR